MTLFTEFAPAERASDEELQADARLLQLSGRLPRLIADTTPLVVIALNRYRQIVYANRKMCELTRRRPEQLLGLRPGEALGCEHARQCAGGCGTTAFCGTCGAVRAILSALAGAEDIQECRLAARDRHALDLRIWTSPFEDEGRRFGLFMAQDISSEKRRDALERAFFHDVLNTAGAALGYAQLEEELPEEAARLRGSVPRLLRRLIEEIQSHRDLNAIELGRYQPYLSAVCGNALLQEVACEWRDQALARGKQLELQTADEVTLQTDPTLLRRVLSNMVKNALEASREGDRIVLRCERANGRARFTVSNPAVMPQQVQLQLFKRSFSTKGVGRGLGTYSMRLLTEQYLGGEISFLSTEGAGTTFVASYPLASSEEREQ